MTWKALFEQAVALHQTGEFARAERIYREALAADTANYPTYYHLAFLLYQQERAEAALQTVEAALHLQPGASEALALHSVLLLNVGRLEEALSSISKVTAREPGDAGAWNNQGVILAGLSRIEEALDSFDQALAITPTMFSALYRRATALMDLKRHAQALAAFDAVLAQNPDVLDAWSNRGLTLYEMERFEEALDCFERATRLDQSYALAWTNRGKTLDKLERFDEALASYDKAIALSADNANAWYARAVTLRTIHRFEPALAAVNKALEQRPGLSPMLQLRGWLLCELGRITDGLTQIQRAAEVSFKATNEPPASEHKQRHDAEQRDYLAQRGVFLKPGDFHLADGRSLSTPAINTGNARAAAAQWAASQPRIVVIDDFLTPAALERLREFCRGSTVWRMSYTGGYLGAMPEDGFANPLLAQIAEELRDSLPTIIGDHPLRKVWGYKYDSRHAGIGVHADQAAVNVNFWITPDEANRDPERGGMVIWTVAAPKAWNVRKYNGDQAAVREFLTRTGAKGVTVPHRANRAVIFDSDLFHETDKIDFKDGYLNRRINVTMLYGRRTYYGT